MRVIHVTLRFDAPGGVETNVREITRRLRARGDDVEVYASDLYDEAGWERRDHYAPVVDGVPVRRFPVRKRLIPGLTMPLMVGLIDALAESGADLIHAHSHRYGHVLEAAITAERCGIPLVVSTHYHPARSEEPPVKKGLLRLQDFGFGMTAYRIAARLVVESELEAALVREFAPRDRIRVVPPGIDLAAWGDPAGDLAAQPSLPSEYFLFVGRVAPNKGLGHLVDAVAALRPPARRPLVVMGRDWGERANLEARARSLGISEAVVWLGHVESDRAYRSVIRRATALVLPSEWEAYGLVLLEAMAAGTPVVASTVGALPEVLDSGRTGRLVPYGDSRALADALNAVVREGDATRAQVEAGRAKAGASDWSVSADRYRSLYREVLA